MPNYDRVALESFVAELHRVWTMAGPPSYADLEILSARVKGPTQETGPRMQVLPKSTTQEILTGRRHQPPRWQWVSRFWAVLRVAAAEAGVDPDSLGTLAEWKQSMKRYVLRWFPRRWLAWQVTAKSAYRIALLATSAIELVFHGTRPVSWLMRRMCCATRGLPEFCELQGGDGGATIAMWCPAGRLRT